MHATPHAKGTHACDHPSRGSDNGAEFQEEQHLADRSIHATSVLLYECEEANMDNRNNSLNKKQKKRCCTSNLQLQLQGIKWFTTNCSENSSRFSDSHLQQMIVLSGDIACAKVPPCETFQSAPVVAMRSPNINKLPAQVVAFRQATSSLVQMSSLDAQMQHANCDNRQRTKWLSKIPVEVVLRVIEWSNLNKRPSTIQHLLTMWH